MLIWKWTVSVRLESQIDDRYIHHILLKRTSCFSCNMSRYCHIYDDTNIYDFYFSLETETDKICLFFWNVMGKIEFRNWAQGLYMNYYAGPWHYVENL